MRGMIIGLSALAITACPPSLSLTGTALSPARPAAPSQARSSAAQSARRSAASLAASSAGGHGPGPVVVAPAQVARATRGRRRHKQQYRRERHETDDRLLD